MTGHIFVIDDERSMVDLLETDLALRGYKVSGYTSSTAALDALSATDAQVVLTDMHMPGVNGLQVCERVVANRPDIPVVVMTAFGSMETAIEAIRAGAWDFVTKPVEMDLLAVVMDRAVRHHYLQEEVRRLTDKPQPTDRFEELIGASPPMQKLFDQIRKIAPTSANVLIMGESGTGKNLSLARFIATVCARMDRLSASTALRFRKICLKANSSATPKVLSRMLASTGKACFSKLRVARCFWMKSAISHWPCKPNFYARWKSEPYVRWEATKRSHLTLEY